jgi:hypothetical protein
MTSAQKLFASMASLMLIALQVLVLDRHRACSSLGNFLTDANDDPQNLPHVLDRVPQGNEHDVVEEDGPHTIVPAEPRSCPNNQKEEMMECGGCVNDDANDDGICAFNGGDGVMGCG